MQKSLAIGLRRFRLRYSKLECVVDGVIARSENRPLIDLGSTWMAFSALVDRGTVLGLPFLVSGKKTVLL